MIGSRSSGRNNPMHTKLLTAPPREEIAAMEPFIGLEPEAVFVVTSARQAGMARDELARAGAVGFDTESKPTFRKGEISGGPHILQFATLEKAFIFHAHAAESRDAVIELLTSAQVTKIGFDLRGDLSQITRRFGVRPEAMVDLGRSFRQLGHRNTIGATSAVAMLFQRRMHKSKSITTSNWAVRQLTGRQLQYAANDAYAAIRVYHALRERQAGAAEAR
jgi:ribonuclease D